MQYNLFMYCNGDPVNNVDPSGHIALPFVEILIGIIIVVFLYALLTGPKPENFPSFPNYPGEVNINIVPPNGLIQNVQLTENNSGVKYKQTVSGKSKKEKSKETPSWSSGEMPMVGESGKEFAKRLCDKHFGKGNYETGPTSDYNRLKSMGIGILNKNKL